MIHSVNQRIVLSGGGNALVDAEDNGNLDGQMQAAKEFSRVVAEIFKTGVKLILTHGNGPQVGNIKRRYDVYDEAEGELSRVPLDYIVADTQGSIAHMLLGALRNELGRGDPSRINKVLAVVTQVLVDQKDPAYQDPQKPIGAWMSGQAAEEYKQHYGVSVKELKEDEAEGWRVVVPSPRPLEVVNIEAIISNFNAGFLTICGGGGGIPVIRNERGELDRTEAVIDKDRTTALIARLVGAHKMVILTAAPGVIDPDDWSRLGEEAEPIDRLTVAEARDMLPDLPKGSMGPKLEACIEAVEAGVESVIANFDNGVAAVLFGSKGTRVVP